MIDPQELKIYLIVMGIICTPIFFYSVITRNNEYRQRVLGEDPAEQIGCARMLFVTLARIFLKAFPWLVAIVFFNLWVEWFKNPTSSNPLFIVYTIIIICVAAGLSKIADVLK